MKMADTGLDYDKLFQCDRARFSEFVHHISHNCKLTDGGFYIAVFGPPKSATKFIFNIISAILRLPQRSILLDYDRDLEKNSLFHVVNELDFTTMLALTAGHDKFIAHAHLMANPHTLRMLDLFHVIPVICLRDIPDALVSLKEQLERQWALNIDEIEAHGYIGTFQGPIPSTAVRKFLSGSLEYQFDFVIDISAAWYFQYYASWFCAKAQHDLDIFFVSYENLLMDESALIVQLIQFLGHEIPKEFVEEVIQKFRNASHLKEKLNENIGVSGRGSKLFTSTQLFKLRTLAEKFDCDLDMFGQMQAQSHGVSAA